MSTLTLSCNGLDLDMTDTTDKKTEPETGLAFRETKRGRNLAVLAAVLGFSGLFYLITIVRMF